ncbi:cupin domain-containing protein [Longispora urticae]
MSELLNKSFDKPDETRMFEGHGHADVLMMGDRPVARGQFEPGWRWSNDVKPIAKTESCQVSHLGYVLEGRMRIFMDDGSEYDLTPGHVVAIPPGHDAEVLGDGACVMLDFGEIAEYAKR